VSVRPPRVLAPFVLACALLASAFAATAGAAPIVFGSSLSPGPSGAFGCGVFPAISDTYGNYSFFANNEPGGCTWSQAGVWGLNSGSDPRARSVPADGRIVAAEILSGPNPSPVSVTIVRQLAKPESGSACCFFVSDTPSFPLTPNAITTLPLNISVERNTKEGVLGVDLVSLSSEVDGGSLPFRQVGPSSVLNIPDGDPMAAGFYPRMGRLANDSGGGRRHEDSLPGYELLVRWTFCATNDITCAGPSGPSASPPPATTPPPAPGPTPAPVVPRLGGKEAPVTAGKAFVGLICGGQADCEGRLELLAPLATASASAVGAKKKPKAIVYGAAGYKLAAGAKGTVAVKLNAKGKKLLRKRSKAGVTLRLTPTGGAATTAKLTLKRAAPKR
jgi:hypothetical protein